MSTSFSIRQFILLESGGRTLQPHFFIMYKTALLSDTQIGRVFSVIQIK